MLLIKFGVRLLFLMNMLIVSSGTVSAEVLSPPTKILFAKDVIIEKYAHGQPLKLFRYSGKWEEKEVSKKLSIVGMADETSSFLISIDKLSRKPKSLKLDFIIQDKSKEYGVIYGEIGVIVRNDTMYPCVYDSKFNIVKIDSFKGKAIEQGKTNTLEIDTGYDPTGEPYQVCVVYINGVGVSLNCPNTENHFGIYLAPKNSITINNIRWGIGSK